MAPVDRREHRQQRMRGAGATGVSTTFAFNLGTLARPAKQASLPPQLSSRRTPVRNTPRGANGSAQRHRSASVQRSGASKKQSTPQLGVVTPQLGKRKRGSKVADNAQADDMDVDELSPDRDEDVRSIEKSRRVAGTVSPIREEFNDPDELSFLGEVKGTTQDSGRVIVEAGQGTPKSTGITASSLVASAEESVGTPLAGRTRNTSLVPQEKASTTASGTRRTTRSSESPPITPAGPSNRQNRQKETLATPSNAPDSQESEDELSPEQEGKPSLRHKPTSPLPILRDDGPIDELSSLQSPAPGTEQSLTSSEKQVPKTGRHLSKNDALKKIPGSKSSKSPRSRPLLEDDEDDVVQSTPAQNRPRRISDQSSGNAVQPTGAGATDAQSPEPGRAMRNIAEREARRNPPQSESPSEESDYEEPELEKPPLQITYQLTPKSKVRPAKERKQQPKASDGQPPEKRQKRGPTQKITVMRLKGFGVKGLTVVDTTKTVVEDLIRDRVGKMTAKMESITDAARQRTIKGQRNHVLAFSEKLEDNFLALQDANDSAIYNANKLKHFKRERKQLQSEFRAIQKERDDIAIEKDDITADFQYQKSEVEDRNELSAWMYDIQAAIRSGKDRARTQGRESEGPDIPLKMLIETVGCEVGSSGGLLSQVHGFNGFMERSVGFLEGRA